jgi:hypothetical protein
VARAKLASFMSDLRGKSGNAVFARTRNYLILKDMYQPLEPLTDLQLSVRVLFGLSAKHWSNITSSQQALWNAFTLNYPYINQFSDVGTLSGFNFFTKFNMFSYMHFGEYIDEPPTDLTAPATILNCSISSKLADDELFINPTFSSIIATNYILVYVSPRRNFGKYYNSQFFYCCKILTSETFPYNIYNDYLNLVSTGFGTPAVGEKIFFRFRTIVDESYLASPNFFHSHILV